MTTVIDPLSSRLVPFIWLFLATIHSKIDNEEGYYPFFRLVLFIALPFALLHLARCLIRARLTYGHWFALACFSYLIWYPYSTIVFSSAEDEVRSIKDALYNLALYSIFFYFAHRYFLSKFGLIDIQAFGRFIVLFALLESAIALMMFFGINFGLNFQQSPWLDGRLHGVMGTPTHLAPVVVIALLFLSTQSLNSTNALKFIFLFLVLLMTGSRGGLASFFGGLSIYLITRNQYLGVYRRVIILFMLSIAFIWIAFALFPTNLEKIIQIVMRSDPDGWEKSRPLMWALRMTEYFQMDLLTQLFGAGHRAVGQTFNSNIEYLLNYGAIYTLAFNILYGALTLRFFLRVKRFRSPDHAFLLMMAVSTYLFMQGNNPTFSAFIHINNFLLIIMLIAYFERYTFHNVVEASRTSSLA